MDNSEIDGALDSPTDPDDADLTYRVFNSTAVGYGIMDPGVTRICASVDSLEKDWLAPQQVQQLGTLLKHEMQETPGSISVFRFGGYIQQAGLSEVVVPVVNEPLGCQHLNVTAIPGEHNCTPPLLGMDIHREMKGGLIIDCKNGSIMFYDGPQRS